jgi:DNA-binding response OmpR family regulator
MKILLMEDDPVLADIVTEYLSEFYDTDHAFDSSEAQELIDSNRYDLFIFDINVPGQSGLELLKELRSFNDTTPAIIVTAYEDTAHLKAGFDAGAHDYVRKPFELEELQMRIENSRRLFNIEQSDPIPLTETLTYYPRKQTIESEKGVQKLRPKDVALLDYFIAHPGRLVSSEELAQNIWEFDELPSDATIRSYIRRLRELVGAEKIVTVRSMGYRYE